MEETCMTRRVIRFKKNWNNKLSCAAFTTTRKCTDEKIAFYSDNLGEVFDVEVDGVVECAARLIGMRKMLLKEMPEELVIVDTGSRTYESAINELSELGIVLGDYVLLLIFYRQGEEYEQEAVLRNEIDLPDKGAG
jgi:hypothetical protein